MNSKHLGDAFDHWKGSIIQRLGTKGLLQDIAVIPMFTDGPWNSEQISAYANLLSVNVGKIQQKNRIFMGNKDDREKYFEDISYSGDLFLDPDIGISLSKNDREHIIIPDIGTVLSAQNDRVILIYQHKGRDNFPEKIEKIVHGVSNRIKNLNSATYDCGNVAMIFFSHDNGRIEKLTGYLKDMLSGDSLFLDESGTPNKRVMRW